MPIIDPGYSIYGVTQEAYEGEYSSNLETQLYEEFAASLEDQGIIIGSQEHFDAYNEWNDEMIASGAFMEGATPPTIGVSLEAIQDLEYQDVDAYSFADDPTSVTLSDLLYQHTGGMMGYLDIGAPKTGPDYTSTFESFEDQLGWLPSQMWEGMTEEEQMSYFEQAGEDTLEWGTGYEHGLGGGRGSYYELYLDKWFDLNPETGRHELSYDAGAFETEERLALDLSREAESDELRKIVRQEEAIKGRSLISDTMGLDEIQELTSASRRSRTADFQRGIEESRMNYYKDMQADLQAMLAELPDYGGIDPYEERLGEFVPDLDWQQP